MEDQLTGMFKMQKLLNQRIGVDTDNLDEAGKIKWVLNYARALSQEIAELTDSVPWKWWAKYQRFDVANARIEVIDMFHFLISLAQVLGLEASDVYNGYLKKNKVNFARQDSGYVSKDESDNQGIF